MPILFQISIEVNSGSVGRIAEQIGKVAISNGWESYITYARNNLESASKKIKIGSKWDVYWHGILTRIFDNHCLSSTRATKKLIREIKLIKPDIIQLHHIHGYFLNMKVLFEYLSSVDTPIVWVFHDCWSMTGHCAHFDYIGCDKWKNLCFNCPQKTSYPASYIFDRSKRNYRQKKELFTSVKNMTIVPVSNWLGNIVGESFLKKYPINVIHNGIDLNMFLPASVEDVELLKLELGLQGKYIILGVAGTWDQRKGLGDFANLQSILPDNWIIVLVGLNKKQQQCLPSSIIAIERTENVKQLATFYSMADVFINPTWEDTFPTTNLEALACGTPVVTYATGGSVESVSEDVGRIVDKGDVNGLFHAAQEIVNAYPNCYSRRCREKVVRLYNKDDRFEDYINVYNSLLKTNK